MSIIRLLTLSLLTLFFAQTIYAQDKWDLKKCVEYAINNNISVKQADIDSRVSRLSYEQAKWAQFGSTSFATSIGMNFGRAINPTTNLFATSQSLFQSLNLQAYITVFNWFTYKRTVEANQYAYDAQVINIDKVKNDITINVANAYLMALNAREQIELGKIKLALTSKQLDNTRKLVDAGSVPELNAAELDAQFATDTSALITAQANYDINVLQLKAILNLDAANAFDLDTPPIETIPVEPISELQPDIVYGIAVQAFPQQKVNDLKILSAEKNVQYYKGQFYPVLSAYGSLGDNYANNTYQKDGYYTQLGNNFNQQIGVQLNVPIFNGNLSRSNYKRAKLNVQTATLNKQSDLLSLKQSIYQAYYNAVASLEKFQANKKAVTTAERSFDLSTKRYNIGLLNTIDYLTNQNNLFTARINQLAAQYDYVFKMKLLEYYKGLGIKL